MGENYNFTEKDVSHSFSGEILCQKELINHNLKNRLVLVKQEDDYFLHNLNKVVSHNSTSTAVYIVMRTYNGNTPKKDRIVEQKIVFYDEQNAFFLETKDLRTMKGNRVPLDVNGRPIGCLRETFLLQD